jgi:tetratricopeptide (TPR) repeat protein
MIAFKKAPLYFIVIGIFLLASLLPSPARADIAPPAQPPGVTLLPETELTRVRMAAETVLMDVAQHAPSGSLGQARVTADFTMHNVGDASETMAVRFPLSANDGFFNFPEITGLEVRVNGQLIATRRIELPDEFDDPIPWAEFDVTFPARQDVFIQVQYTQEGTGEYPYLSFKYILETGAGWYGTIGEGKIIVHLPYEANAYNVIFNAQIGWSETTPGGILNGREVNWFFEDLEPTNEDNFEVSLVMPSAWQKALTEQTRVSNNPQDGEAWGRLGKVYKEISRLRKGLREDLGGQELYQLSQEAYEQAITLLPNDALWHAGYADLLWTHYYYYEYFSEQPNFSELLHILQLLDHSLTLAPGNSVATELLTSIAYTVPEAVQLDGSRFTIHYLTATPLIPPTSTETPPPTEPLSPTPTPTPLLQDAATATPTTAPSPTDTSLPTNPTLPPPTAIPSPAPAPTRPFLCGVPLLLFLPALRRWKKQ